MPEAGPAVNSDLQGLVLRALERSFSLSEDIWTPKQKPGPHTPDSFQA